MQLLHSCSKQPCLKSPPCVSCTCCTAAQSSEQSCLSNPLCTPCSGCTAAHSSKQFCLSNPLHIPCSGCSAAQSSPASTTHLAFHAVIAQLLKGFVSILDPWQQVPQVVPVHGLHDLACIQRTHAGGGRSAAQLPHSFLYQRLNLGKIALQHVRNAGLQVARQYVRARS